jgi:hypothetical protein
MNEHLRMIFERMFPRQAIVCIKTIGKQDDLYETALNLRENKKRLRYFKKWNASEGLTKGRMMIGDKRCGICPASVKMDAEVFQKIKIRLHCKNIKKEIQVQKGFNGGVAYVIF